MKLAKFKSAIAERFLPCFVGVLTSASFTSCKIGGSANNESLSGHTHEDYVERNGDSMDGPLRLPVNGLTVGTTDLSVVGPNLGIGTARPTAALDIRGPTGNYITANVQSSPGLDIRGSSGSYIYANVSSVNPVLNIYAPSSAWYAMLQFYMNGAISGSISGYGASGSGGLTFGSTSVNNGVFNFFSQNTQTAAVYGGLVHQVYSSGTAANGFGYGQRVDLESASGNMRNASRIDTLWSDATDATRTSALAFLTVSNAGVLTEQVRITGAGDVGIGTTGPSEKLHVVGNLRVQGGTDCTLGNGGGATNCTSDIRLKRNVHVIENALEKIDQISGVEFTWNEKSLSPGRKSIGVIAQEIEKVFPTAVITNASGYLAVDYAVLVSPLIQASKELNTRYEILKKENDSLKTEVQLLRDWACSQKRKPGFCR